MDSGIITQFRDLGPLAAMAFAAMGSALGAGEAGMAAIGAWKKNYSQNKAASFILVAFVGEPLTQTVYGMILMKKMAEYAMKGYYLWGTGVLAGIAIGLSAWMQGKGAACACDAMGETGKEFGKNIVIIGITETVALFVMAFTLGVLEKLAP